jgi:hypothetical protein
MYEVARCEWIFEPNIKKLESEKGWKEEKGGRQERIESDKYSLKRFHGALFSPAVNM